MFLHKVLHKNAIIEILIIDKIVQLKSHCGTFGKIVIISQLGGDCINIETLIRKYELSTLPLNLYHQEGQLIREV